MSFKEAVSDILKVKPEPKATKKEDGVETMNDVIDLFSICEAEKCKRPERRITDKGDLVVVETKTYHRGCEPTREERNAQNRSSV
jgi:hypothetical protein